MLKHIYLLKHNDNDLERFLNCWTPISQSELPTSRQGKRTRRLLISHFQDPIYKDWLCVSKKQNGVLCKPCVLFGSQAHAPGKGRGKGRVQKLTTLVTKSLIKFHDLKGTSGSLDSHMKKDFHLTFMNLMENYINVIEGKKEDIRNTINTSRAIQAECNQKALQVSIVDTVLFHARQNIALRGNRGEVGVVNSTGDEPSTNDGNFRASLRMRIRAGD